MQFANSSDVWDGKPPRLFRPSCHFRTQELRTQNCPVLCLLPLRHHCQPRRRVRTQTCPLFPRLLKNVPRPLKTPIQPIGAVIGCWPIWVYSTMRHRCLAPVRLCLGLGFWWPCQLCCKAGYSSVPKKSTAVSAPPSMVCAPVC